MNSKIQNKKIAIIGAGISGIILARKLSTDNEVIVFDKSRGIGGRMATRRVGQYNFDHGAQFFTAKSAEFQDICQKSKEDNIIVEWNGRFVKIVGNKIDLEDEQKNKIRYVAKPQMNSLCKYLARDLNILLGQEIESTKFENQKWSLKTTQNEIFNEFDYLFIAIPSHQAVNLIPKDFEHFDIVANIKMSGCFSLMLGFKEKLALDFDFALVEKSIIANISLNSSKPQRPDGFSLLVTSTNEWADDNIEKDPQIIKEQLIASLQKIIDFNLNQIEHENIHKWRYANANLRKEQKSLFDRNLNLGVCGDWLIGGKVENAFLSGIDLYNNVRLSLNITRT